MEILMDNLAEEANAGVRLELVPLMKVPGMTGARARALHAAGITRPDLLALVSRHDRNGVPAHEPSHRRLEMCEYSADPCIFLDSLGGHGLMTPIRHRLRKRTSSRSF